LELWNDGMPEEWNNGILGIVKWLYGYIVIWLNGRMAIWLYGYIVKLLNLKP
jgi:hypothetical protein